MEKLIKITCLIVGIVLATSASGVAQEGKIYLGGNLMYGSGAGGDASNLNNHLGLKIGGYYGITDKILAGASFGYFFPEKEQGAKLTVSEFNIDGHYLFVNDEAYNVYGLAGINIVSLKVNYPNDSDYVSGSISTSETGLNIGIGGEYGMSFGNLFGELKYAGLGGNADELVLDAGVRFPVN